MIPTLLGISFLVFMLIALSPGGIGAALRGQSGSQEATSLVLYQAYLEDRYGLNDPVFVQYGRWLSRISPIKLGAPDQIDPTGEIIRPPKPLKLPPLAGEWYAVGHVPSVAEPLESIEIGSTAEERNRAYRAAANQYAQDRADLIGARVELESALREYAMAAHLERAVERDGDIRLHVFRRNQPDDSLEEMNTVRRAGEAAIETYTRASLSRERLAAVWRARPYQTSLWRVPLPFTDVSIPMKLGPVHLAAPDLGTSFSLSRPVSTLIAEHLPITLLLNALAFPIIYLIAVPTGMLAATRKGTLFDILSGGLFVALWSIPVVWAGVLAVGFFANNSYLGWFPVAGLHDATARQMTFLPQSDAQGVWHRGFVFDTLWHLCLPVACLVYTGFAILSKQTRAAMLDNFSADYVRTAKAKGVSGRDIVLKHVFRNSLLPLITIFATLFPAMLSGSVVIESIFSIEGMGKLILDSINLRDRELLLANVLMVGGLNLVGLLLADILYAFVDPRITYD